MRFEDLVTEIFYNLSRNKLRSFLTIIGIFVGTFAVMMIWALSTGLEHFLSTQVSIISDPRMIDCFPPNGINPKKINSLFMGSFDKVPKIVKQNDKTNEAGFGNLQIVYFKQKDIKILRCIPHVVDVSPGLMVPGQWIKISDFPNCYEIYISPYRSIIDKDLIAGEPIIKNNSSQIILPYSYCRALGIDPQKIIGKTAKIKIGKHPFLKRYIQLNLLRTGIESLKKGVQTLLKASGKNYNFSKLPQDSMSQIFKVKIVGILKDNIFCKYAFVSRELTYKMGRFFLHQKDLFTPKNYGLVARVLIDNPKNINEVRNTIEKAGMQTTTLDEIWTNFKKILFVVRMALILFGVIAFAVAILNIINTLMMSIHERKSEIGVLKALGATKSSIRLLFALEASLMSFLGGMLGILISFITGKTTNYILSIKYPVYWDTYQLFYFQPSFTFVVLMLVTFIGFCGGLYPANRAARLEPVEILRYS